MKAKEQHPAYDVKEYVNNPKTLHKSVKELAKKPKKQMQPLRTKPYFGRCIHSNEAKPNEFGRVVILVQVRYSSTT